MSTLQHPDEAKAPASIVPAASTAAAREHNLESLLGIVPHSIRGSLRDAALEDHWICHLDQLISDQFQS